MFFKAVWLNKKEIRKIFVPKVLKKEPMNFKLKYKVYLLQLELLSKPKHCKMVDFNDPIYIDENGIFQLDMDEDIAYLLK